MHSVILSGKISIAEERQKKKNNTIKLLDYT